MSANTKPQPWQVPYLQLCPCLSRFHLKLNFQITQIRGGKDKIKTLYDLMMAEITAIDWLNISYLVPAVEQQQLYRRTQVGSNATFSSSPYLRMRVMLYLRVV